MSSGLGNTLLKNKQKKAREVKARYQTLIRAAAIEGERAPPTEEGKKLKSIWETNNMDDFLTIADEREQGYQAERQTRVVVSGAHHVLKGNKVVPHTDDRDWFALSSELTIPHRPSWNFKMKKDEVERQEKAMFLNWRRELSKMEEKNAVLMTPYEKNLEVWRQLWRVVERSDVVLQLVDARNPLAFRSADFERYVATHENKVGTKKESILLINKADLLTENQRKAWATYFEDKGIKFYFFAALPLEEEKKDSDSEPESSSSDDSDESDYEDIDDEALEDDDDLLATHTRNKKEKKRESRRLGAVQYQDPRMLELSRQQQKEDYSKPKEKKILPPTKDEKERDARLKEPLVLNSYDVLSPIQLVDLVTRMRKPLGVTDFNTPVNVGMVGYPNVGKSSTINAIIGCHKVVVSATPGKTKHFQTLMLPGERRVMVCDCPGLVFPSFAATRETMVCDGILPVDTVKDYVVPVGVICQRIPRHVLEFAYAACLDPELDQDESTNDADIILNLIARRKGYMTEHDKPNRSKIAKEMLKHYVDGRLVYAHPPPHFKFEIPEPEEETEEEEEDTKKKSSDEESENDEEEEDWEDEESIDEEDWEDLSSADEARGLDGEGKYDYNPPEEEEEEGPAPKFITRNRGDELTQAEIFNYERNTVELIDKKKRGKKKKTNHQIEPDSVGVRINEDGEREIMIDSDDGIVEHYGPGVDIAYEAREKRKSKRAVRREMRRAGMHVPQSKATKVVAIEGFK